MIHRALVILSTACCLLVLASFAVFARDQMAGASQHQQNAELPGGPATPSKPAPAQHQASQPGRFIKGAGSTLTSPFSSIVQSNNAWVDHGIPTVLALAAYGLGLGYLARFSRGFA